MSFLSILSNLHIWSPDKVESPLTTYFPFKYNKHKAMNSFGKPPPTGSGFRLSKFWLFEGTKIGERFVYKMGQNSRETKALENVLATASIADKYRQKVILFLIFQCNQGHIHPKLPDWLFFSNTSLNSILILKKLIEQKCLPQIDFLIRPQCINCS